MLDRRFIARHGLHGLVGTVCVAVGSLGVGWLPLETELADVGVVDALRGGLTGSLVARGLVFLGLALLLQSWLVLGGELGHGASHRRELPWILGLWEAPLLLAPPLFSRDVYSYYVQGRLLDAGIDPTTSGVSQIPGWFQDGADPMWAESPTPYGPLFLWIERLIASFAHPNAYLAGLLFRATAVIGVAILLVVVPKVADLHGVDPDRAAWLGVLNPLVVMHFVIGAHNDALMVALVLSGLWWAMTCRCTWGAAAIGLAAAVKPIALLALPFVGLAWAGVGATWWARIRSWLLAALVAGIVFVTAMLAVGAGDGLLAAAFGTPTGVLTWLSPSTALGKIVGGATTWLGLTATDEAIVTTVRAIGVVTSLVLVGWLILFPGRRSPVRGAALAFVAVIVLGPVVHPWYLLWALPLFAASGLSRRWQQATIILTAAFAVHGMVESSTTSDNFLDVTDGITFLVAAAIVAIIALASPQERRLLLDRGSEAPPRVGHSRPHD